MMGVAASVWLVDAEGVREGLAARVPLLSEEPWDTHPNSFHTSPIHQPKSKSTLLQPSSRNRHLKAHLCHVHRHGTAYWREGDPAAGLRSASTLFYLLWPGRFPTQSRHHQLGHCDPAGTCMHGHSVCNMTCYALFTGRQDRTFLLLLRLTSTVGVQIPYALQTAPADAPCVLRSLGLIKSDHNVAARANATLVLRT